MHILYILDFYKPNIWGVEVLLDEIIKYFWKKNKVSVITWNFNWNLPELEKIWNITIYRVKSKFLQTYPFSAYKKWKEIISDVDIIHANNFYSAFVWSKLSKKYNKKSVLHIHWLFGKLWSKMLYWNYFLRKIKFWKFLLLEKYNLNWNFNKIICISKHIYDVCKFKYWVGEQKLELIYNWLDYKKWKDNVDKKEVQKIKNKYNLNDNFSILFFGRIEKMKWWDIFLNNIKYISWENKIIFIVHWDFKLFEQKIIENKAYDIKYNNWIVSNFKIKNNEVFVIPWVKHSMIWNYIKSVSCCVFPSILEPFWLMALETSILNIPIVASNNGAIPEVVFWKVNFFDIWDKNSFVKAVENTKNWIHENIPKKDFSIENMLQNIEKLYTSLTS